MIQGLNEVQTAQLRKEQSRIAILLSNQIIDTCVKFCNEYCESVTCEITNEKEAKLL
jgi:hypothetical protein